MLHRCRTCGAQYYRVHSETEVFIPVDVEPVLAWQVNGAVQYVYPVHKCKKQKVKATRPPQRLSLLEEK